MIAGMTSAGVELEADPRHPEFVVKGLGLEGAKAAMVQGSKDEVKNGDKSKNVEVAIDSVQKAKDSSGGALVSSRRMSGRTRWMTTNCWVWRTPDCTEEMQQDSIVLRQAGPTSHTQSKNQPET